MTATTRPPDRRFGRERRLRKRAEYRRVYDEGRRSGGRYFLCFFAPGADRDADARLGVTVVRRVGGAVRRNRLRRVVREFFRLRRAGMPKGLEVVVNARPEAAKAETRTLWSDLERIFRRAGALTPPES